MENDVIGQTIGNFGKWQLRTILLIFLCKVPTSWFMAVIIFSAPEPDSSEYWCRPPNGYSQINLNTWKQIAHPLLPNNQIDNCHVYDDVLDDPGYYLNNETGAILHMPNKSDIIISCHNFEFHSDFNSLVQKFELVCSRYLLLAVTQCFHIFGLLSGGIFAYYLLKRISPRRVMLIGMMSQIVCGNATGQMSIYGLHLLFRYLSASTCALMYTAGHTIITDITGGRAKIITTVLFELFWSIGLILLPVVAIFTNNWSQLYMAISMPAVGLIFLHRLIPDSPRWLLQKGRIDDAKTIVIKAAKANKRSISENLDLELKLQATLMLAEPVEKKWKSLWDGAPKRYVLLAVHFAWAVYILIFNTMVLNIRAWGVDHLHVNTVAIGFSEIMGVFLGLYLILYTKRRWLWTGLISILCGCIAYLTWFIPDSLRESNIIALQMMPCMAIKMAISSSLSILTTCTADLVAPEKQKILMFSTSIWSRIWFLWAPMIYTLKKYIGPLIPLNIFASFVIVGGILMCIVYASQRSKKKSIDLNRDSVTVILKTIS